MVFRGPVDLEPHVLRVAVALEIRVGGEKPVHDVAPRAPFAADVDDHVAARGARDAQRDVEILRGVARGIEFERQRNRFLGGEDGNGDGQANGQQRAQETAAAEAAQGTRHDQLVTGLTQEIRRFYASEREMRRAADSRYPSMTNGAAASSAPIPASRSQPSTK